MPLMPMPPMPTKWTGPMSRGIFMFAPLSLTSRVRPPRSRSTRSARRSRRRAGPCVRAPAAAASSCVRIGLSSRGQIAGKTLRASVSRCWIIQPPPAAASACGIGRLVVVERMRIGHQQRRPADHRELGDGGGAGRAR